MIAGRFDFLIRQTEKIRMKKPERLTNDSTAPVDASIRHFFLNNLQSGLILFKIVAPHQKKG
jgi:hypothetical protein